MHSSQYLRLARAANDFGFSIVAMAAIVGDEGTYPGAHCVLYDDSRPFDRAFAVSMGVLPTDRDEAFFCSSVYDCSRERAFERFARKIEFDVDRFGEVEGDQIVGVIG